MYEVRIPARVMEYSGSRSSLRLVITRPAARPEVGWGTHMPFRSADASFFSQIWLMGLAGASPAGKLAYGESTHVMASASWSCWQDRIFLHIAREWRRGSSPTAMD